MIALDFCCNLFVHLPHSMLPFSVVTTTATITSAHNHCWPDPATCLFACTSDYSQVCVLTKPKTPLLRMLKQYWYNFYTILVDWYKIRIVIYGFNSTVVRYGTQQPGSDHESTNAVVCVDFCCKSILNLARSIATKWMAAMRAQCRKCRVDGELFFNEWMNERIVGAEVKESIF